MTQLVTTKSTGLAKTGEPVRQLASRLERARQSRNEKVARADAEYVEAVRRALGAIEPASETTAPVSEPPPQDVATA
jgi:hypothetical protein